MTKKEYIALADAIRLSPVSFSDEQISVLADFCQAQSPAFLRQRWLDYVAGKVGKGGGKKDK